MAISESIAAYDVVIVPFPNVDWLAEKRRPALVISTGALAKLGLLWVAMITSRLAKIACIEPERVVRRAGKLDARNASLVSAKLARFVAARRA